jgi:DNA (cytosine-5)-methyltransferase 1
MRMLEPRELFRAQSFPAAYQIAVPYEGRPLTKTAQTRMCGNSVPPVMAEAIVRAQFGAAERADAPLLVGGAA